MVEAYSRSTIGDLGEIAYQLIPTIDVGSGFQTVSPVDGLGLIASASIGGITVMNTVSVRLDAPPVVRLLILNAGSTPENVNNFILRAFRCAGASFVQGPDGVLV
jgi:hypothetical protein